MNVFWSNGYHGTSLPDLLRATRLSRGSLYAAFGDKRGIFLLALDRVAGGTAVAHQYAILFQHQAEEATAVLVEAAAIARDPFASFFTRKGTGKPLHGDRVAEQIEHRVFIRGRERPQEQSFGLEYGRG